VLLHIKKFLLSIFLKWCSLRNANLLFAVGTFLKTLEPFFSHAQKLITRSTRNLDD
jgi:hypothetical protein